MEDMNEELDEMREDFEDLRGAWVAQTRKCSQALAGALGEACDGADEA